MIELNKNINRANQSQRGAAVMTVLVAVGVLGTLSMAVLSSVSSSFKLHKTAKDNVGARYLAEAGLAIAVDDLRKGGTGGVGLSEQRMDFGGGDLWVETEDLGSGMVSIVSTGVQGRSASRVELVLAARSNSFYSWGAFGDLGLTMDSNAHVDSYNSNDGAYSADAGSGNDTYDSSDGNVGANGNVELDSNSLVFGDAVPGPEGSVILNGSSGVSGSTTPNTDVVDLPAIEFPATVSTGDWTPSGTVTLASGNHAFDTFMLDGNSTLSIIGPATIVCDNMFVQSNSTIQVDTTLGPVEFYVYDDFVMNSNTTITARNQVPGDLALFLNTNNIIDPDVNVDLDLVDFDSNAVLYGTVYAPNAHVEINSNFELFGSLVAKSVHLDSNSYVHFDEALMDAGDDSNGADFVRVSWRERPVAGSEISW
ncbi:MAG: hypothetical protein ACI8QC_002162 [Planctomycetota bacterium]|jgi:hypothetical protein